MTPLLHCPHRQGWRHPAAHQGFDAALARDSARDRQGLMSPGLHSRGWRRVCNSLVVAPSREGALS